MMQAMYLGSRLRGAVPKWYVTLYEAQDPEMHSVRDFMLDGFSGDGETLGELGHSYSPHRKVPSGVEDLLAA